MYASGDEGGSCHRSRSVGLPMPLRFSSTSNLRPAATLAQNASRRISTRRVVRPRVGIADLHVVGRELRERRLPRLGAIHSRAATSSFRTASSAHHLLGLGLRRGREIALGVLPAERLSEQPFRRLEAALRARLHLARRLDEGLREPGRRGLEQVPAEIGLPDRHRRLSSSGPVGGERGSATLRSPAAARPPRSRRSSRSRAPAAELREGHCGRVAAGSAAAAGPGWPRRGGSRARGCRRRPPAPRSPASPPGRGHVRPIRLARLGEARLRRSVAVGQPQAAGGDVHDEARGIVVVEAPVTTNGAGMASSCSRRMMRWTPADPGRQRCRRAARQRRHTRRRSPARPCRPRSDRRAVARRCRGADRLGGELLQEGLNCCRFASRAAAAGSSARCAGMGFAARQARSRTRRSRCTDRARSTSGMPFAPRVARWHGSRSDSSATEKEALATQREAERPRRSSGARTTAITRAVSTTVANSPWRSDRAIAWICSARCATPSGPTRSKVAVASDTTQVTKPRLPAIRAVVETQ